MKTKLLTTTLLAMGLCAVFSAQAFAFNKVNLAPVAISSVPVSPRDCPPLVDEEMLEQIGKFVDDKLRVSALPFELVAKDNELKNADTLDKMSDEMQCAIIPLVLDDSSHGEHYLVDGVVYHKTIVHTNISLMFCAYGGALQNRVSFLYNIPLNGYGVLRTNKPVPLEWLKRQFLANAEQMISKRLAIPANINQYLNPGYGKTKTYRVRGVDVSKVKGMEKFPSLFVAKQILPTVASAYTAAYAKAHPGYVVLPECYAGEEWKKKVIQHLNNNVSERLEEETGDVNDIDLSLLAYEKIKLPAKKGSKNASFYNKWQVVVSMEDLTNKTKVRHVRNYDIPSNVPNITQINLPGVFGSAARELAIQK